MDGIVGRFAGAAAAMALVSFSAPALAETVQITCDVERALAGFGGPRRPNDRSEWRFSVDTDAPSITWISRSGRMNSPTGGDWVLGRAVAAARTSRGDLTACLIDTGVCGQTISTDMYDETVTAVEISGDLRRVKLMMTMLFVDGVRTTELFAGGCTRAARPANGLGTLQN